MTDPYKTLGVAKTATADEIKKAYRQLAKKYHPDMHAGDASVERKFKDISAAYALLSDPAKRGAFDRGVVDAAGNPTGFGGGFNPGGFGNRARRAQGRKATEEFGFDAADLFNDLFSNFGSGGGRQRGNAAARAGADVPYTLSLSFTEAALGAKKRIALEGGNTIELTVPPGSATGQVLRLKGKGRAGVAGGKAGDALITLQVAAHPYFRVEGRDIHLDLPVTLPEAVLGATLTVPTLTGKVAVKIPPGSNTDTTLRLRGKGTADDKGNAGDQFVRLKVVLPDAPDKDLAAFVQKWGGKHPYDPRAKAGLS